MRFLPYVLRHLTHNWIRTASTIFAIAVSVFLFCTLRTVLEAVDWGLRSASSSRLVVRNAISLMYSLPLTYKERVRTIPGVRSVAMSNFMLLAFGGSADFFRHPAYAVDAAEYLGIYPQYRLSTEERRAFLEDRRGCIVGPDTAKEFGWKVGDAVELQDKVYGLPRPFEFVVRGIYSVDLAKDPGTDGRILFFHHTYLVEATEHREGAGFLVVEVDDPRRAAAVSTAIDRTFEDSERQTRTETESAFRSGMVSMAGNLSRLLNVIGIAVVFTILLVTANTMSMAVRERRKGIAVLKTLGYPSSLVMALVLAEALVVGSVGGALGILLGRVAIQALPRVPVIGWAVQQFPGLDLSPGVGLAGGALAVTLALLAGAVPAVAACRAKVTDLLRAV